MGDFTIGASVISAAAVIIAAILTYGKSSTDPSPKKDECVKNNETLAAYGDLKVRVSNLESRTSAVEAATAVANTNYVNLNSIVNNGFADIKKELHDFRSLLLKEHK